MSLLPNNFLQVILACKEHKDRGCVQDTLLYFVGICGFEAEQADMLAVSKLLF